MIPHGTIAEREFWRKVKRARDIRRCWTWTGTLSETGYGIYSSNRKNYLAHRVAYELAYEKSPADKHVLHACDNRACVNPRHLRLGSSLENAADTKANWYLLRRVPVIVNDSDEYIRIITESRAERAAEIPRPNSIAESLSVRPWKPRASCRILEVGAIAIRRDYYEHGVNIQTICAAYNLKYAEVRDLLRRVTWGNLQ